MLLALVLREQPVTAHHLYKIIAGSPVTSINASKGQLYPAVRRLKANGFINAEPVTSDARGTEQLSVSDTGQAAVRDWVSRIDMSHVVLDDPFRTRVLSFDLLSKEERLVWITNARELVKAKRQVVDAYDAAVDLPYKGPAYRNAMGALAAKLEWLDELLLEVAQS